jgi:1-phosphofructokinase family hexose kinase
MIYTVSTNPALDLILTVPAIEFEVVLRAYEVRREMGGKGFNVSRFLKALGVANVAVAFAAGFTGQALEAGLQRNGVKTDFIYLDGESRTNVVIQEPEGQRHIKANQPGATVTPQGKAAFWDLLHRRAQPDDLWVLTGSLAPGLDTDFYAEVSEELRSRGARVVLDTSGPPLRSGCAARPLLVKPNIVEAEEFTGLTIRSIEVAAAAATAFHDAGAQNVILSLGKDGAIVAGDGELLHLQPPPVTVKTAVGAGDAVVAGAVWALLQALPIGQVGLWGVTTGTVTAMHDDLQPHHRSELDAILQKVTVRVLPKDNSVVQ